MRTFKAVTALTETKVTIRLFRIMIFMVSLILLMAVGIPVRAVLPHSAKNFWGRTSFKEASFFRKWVHAVAMAR